MPEEVKIRRAREDELPIIKQLSVKQTILELDEVERQQKERIEKENMRRLDAFFRKPGNDLFVAEARSGEMAGYVWLGVSERPFSGVEIGWICDIEVLPQFRGRGVGEALMRQALEASKERGFARIGLMVNQKNKAAWSLYEKLGFQTEYRIMSKIE